MAEFVEKSLEELLPVFEQLKLVQLFSPDEVCDFIKNCRDYEYKLCKQTKVAKDFLAYAAYLEEILDLIVERRKELKFLHRYDQIDRPLKHKCAHLYRICAARFKIFSRPSLKKKIFIRQKMEYHNKEIAFLHNAKMRKLCSQAYTRLLQIYAHLPENHVRAARFEFFDNNSAENARTLILMGLRKFPQFIPLWVTHFKIELRYVARLLERREFLIKTNDRSSHIHSINNEEIKKSFDPINTGDDEFLKLSLAKVVFEMAVKTIRERGQKAGLIRQFIQIAEDCGEFTKELVLSMREYMSIYGLELEEEIDQMEVPNEELFEIDTKRMGIDEIKKEENIVKVERKSVLDGFNPDDPEIKKLLEKATLTEDYDSKPLDEVLKRSKTQEKKIRKSQNSQTAGESWFGLPASEMDEEKRRDLELIQMRNILDPKQHYKKSDRNVLPKYFQIGQIVESSADFYSARLNKKQRKNTLAEELMNDHEIIAKNKKHYAKIIQKREATKGVGVFKKSGYLPKHNKKRRKNF
uniref:Fcf2 pre-rRNA processing C-terminal domain-containing protein n=1 Tax=Meloidogyne incognita TaxID=6306 RepID=A0A914LR10_MELIC